jgi:hypothetical protein
MTSAAQSEANRANAQSSTGPATAAGKETSRFNATRHGLTSQVACMTWEDRDAFNQFCAALVAESAPEGPAETQLAQSIAEDNWRLNRARAIEHNIFALGGVSREKSSTTPLPAIESDDPQIVAALAQAATFRDEGKTFGLITLYEQRIHRNLERNRDRLRQLQSERRAARAQALNERIEMNEINELHRRRGQPEPADAGPGLNGFVFSPSEIELATFRRRRANFLGEASQLLSSQPVPRGSARPAPSQEAA